MWAKILLRWLDAYTVKVVHAKLSAMAACKLFRSFSALKYFAIVAKSTSDRQLRNFILIGSFLIRPWLMFFLKSGRSMEIKNKICWNAWANWRTKLYKVSNVNNNRNEINKTENRWNAKVSAHSSESSTACSTSLFWEPHVLRKLHCKTGACKITWEGRR